MTTLRDLCRVLATALHVTGVERYAARITRMQRSKAWGNLGDLKRELLDLWTEERNTLAKAVMQDIEKQRRKVAR